MKELLHQQPKFTPNEIKGAFGYAGNSPERRFYILDDSRPDQDRVWEVDLYVVRDPDGTEHRAICLLCPLCERHLMIKNERKAILIDEERGHLSVEPFRCSWEGDFGSICCSFQAAIEPPPPNNKDKNEFRSATGQVFQIAGVFKKV